VYWIRLPEHNDVFSQGYVGITVGGIKKRFREHRHNARAGKNYPISHAINKYGEKLQVDTLLVADSDYCRQIENILRPAPNIGWNINIGGESPPMLGRKHSEAARLKMLDGSRSVSYETRKENSKHLIAPKVNGPEWLHPASNSNVWRIADLIHKYLTENPKQGYTKVSKHFKLDTLYSSFAICKKIKKQNWNPVNDSNWLEWVSKFKQI